MGELKREWALLTEEYDILDDETFLILRLLFTAFSQLFTFRHYRTKQILYNVSIICLFLERTMTENDINEENGINLINNISFLTYFNII